MTRLFLTLAALLVLTLAPVAAPLAAAQTPPDIPSDAPQIHLSYLGDSYGVTFASLVPLSEPRVTWTAGEGGESGTAVATLRGNGRADDSVYTYGATIPARALQYTVTTNSGIHTFAVAAPPTADSTVRVAFIADHGRSAEAQAITAAMKKADVDLVIHRGDTSYANGNAAGWDAWFPQIEPLASRVPWMPALGNHEVFCTTGVIQETAGTTKCDADTYRARFQLPNPEKFYYSFDWGPVRFVSIDTEAYHPEPRARQVAPQTDAREQETYIADAFMERRDAWSIAYYHRPAYSSNSNHGSDLKVRANLSPIFERTGVDLALAGHDHHYERSWPIKDAQPLIGRTDAVEADGVIHIVSGGAGRALYKEFIDMPEWSAMREATFEFLLLEISPTQMRVSAVRPDGSVLDAFSIVRAPPPIVVVDTDDDATPPTNETPDPVDETPQSGTDTESALGASVDDAATPAHGTAFIAASLVALAVIARRRSRA